MNYFIHIQRGHGVKVSIMAYALSSPAAAIWLARLRERGNDWAVVRANDFWERGVILAQTKGFDEKLSFKS